jgi:putative transposase
MGTVRLILAFLRAFFTSRAALAAENLAFRQQLIVLRRSVKRPHLRKRDRIFWSWLSRLWTRWRSALLIVQPATLVRWHRQGFRLYRARKSRKKIGRPQVNRQVRDLIRRMCQGNSTWGAPRIQSELALLGHDVAESTVAQSEPPSQNWRTFLTNHIGQIAAIDFFTVPTIIFRVLYVFLVLRHDQRRIVHFNVTASPTAQWTAQQVVEAFPLEGNRGSCSGIVTASTVRSSLVV